MKKLTAAHSSNSCLNGQRRDRNSFWVIPSAPKSMARSHTHRENISYSMRYRGVQDLRLLPEVKLLTGEDDHWHWGNHLKPISIGMVNITGAYLSASEIHLSLSSPVLYREIQTIEVFSCLFLTKNSNEFRYGDRYNLTIWSALSSRRLIILRWKAGLFLCKPKRVSEIGWESK